MNFTLVAGISSSGKSTFINATNKGAFVLPKHLPYLAASIPHGGQVHYNTLRYAGNNSARVNDPFFSDPLLASLAACGRAFAVNYIFCERSALIKRVTNRRSIEHGKGRYPSNQICAAIDAIDYQKFHRNWLTILRGLSPSVRILHATNGLFREITARKMEILNRKQAAPLDELRCSISPFITPTAEPLSRHSDSTQHAFR